MILASRITKLVISWVIVYIALVFLCFSFWAAIKPYDLINILKITSITGVVYIFLCVGTGYLLLNFLKRKSFLMKISLILCATLCVTTIGIIINKYLMCLFFGINIYQSKLSFFQPLLINAMVALTAAFFEQIRWQKEESEKTLNEIKVTIDNNTHVDALSIRENEMYHVIMCDDLIYLSSHGKKTILHTINRDYETHQLIKIIEKKLSEKFIRIHRQFIINIKMI